MQSISSVSVSENGNGFSIALDHSFQVYSSLPIKRIFHKEFVNFTITHVSVSDNGDFAAFSCIPITGDKSIQKVFIWNNKYGECVTHLDFKEDIINIILRPPFLLIVFSESVCLYDMKNGITHLEIITYENPSGAADLSLSTATHLMCVCGLNEGEVKIMDINNESDVLCIKAHYHQVSFARFSSDASIIATSGQTGTIIRLFDTVTGSLLSILRRGNLPQKILSLSISNDNKYVAAVSASGTIHLFDGTKRNKNTKEAERAIAKYKSEKCEVATSSFNKENELLALFETGHLIKFKCAEEPMDIIEKCFLLAH